MILYDRHDVDIYVNLHQIIIKYESILLLSFASSNKNISSV